MTLTVSDPNAEYKANVDIWTRNTAVIAGERAAKEHDGMVGMKNMLIPFSATMNDQQYQFYKAEAELPGVSSQFAAMLAGGLLRKPPLLEVTDPADKAWITDEFTADNQSLISFLTEAFAEEMDTQRAWIVISHPTVTDPDNITREQMQQMRPYPVLYKAVDVINWEHAVNSVGILTLTQVVIRTQRKEFSEDEFHPTIKEQVKVHELDDQGNYQIRVFEDNMLVATIDNILSGNERLKTLPVFPLNGSVNIIKPILTSVIDKEVALYNKMSRRNHLLYGAATFTPVVSTDMLDDDFSKLVNAGLGSWLKVGKEDKIDVLKTPTDALTDLDRSIKDAIEEIAKLGVRMLASDSGDQSGVALQIRAANQNVTIGNLSVRISQTIATVIAFMISWHGDKEVLASDVRFSLNDDFQTIPLDQLYIRLITEWYETGIIPRSLWLLLMKDNELVPGDYDDEVGIKEIGKDALLNRKEDKDDYDIA